jgi:AAA15 family ATPase/GTPase
VENFRSYEETDWIDVDDKLLIVGKNNAGKSNLLRAVDMLLDVSPTSPHEVGDAHLQNTEDNIVIECRFTDLSDSECEAFADYHDDEQLWLRVEFPFNDERQTAKNKQFVLKEQKPAVEAFRGLNDATADELEQVYQRHESKLEPHRVDDWSGNLYKNEIVPTIENYLESDDAEFEAVSI